MIELVVVGFLWVCVGCVLWGLFTNCYPKAFDEYVPAPQIATLALWPMVLCFVAGLKLYDHWFVNEVRWCPKCSEETLPRIKYARKHS